MILGKNMQHQQSYPFSSHKIWEVKENQDYWRTEVKEQVRLLDLSHLQICQSANKVIKNLFPEDKWVPKSILIWSFCICNIA